MSEKDAGVVIERVMSIWNKKEYHDKVKIEYVKECLDYSKDE